MTGERLQNVLARAGVASRRASAALIEAGAVTVDGLVVREPGARIAADAEVRVNGRPVVAAERRRTVVLNKPAGVLSTMSDPFGGRTVADLVRTPERLVPVGRLDRDSEGLLLLSNDGDLANRLTHPRYEHRKTYLVRVAGRWSAEKLATLRSPLRMDDGYVIRPVPVEVVREEGDGTRLLKFTLGEGRKRQIRRMCSAAHLVVLELRRVAVGDFRLPPDLKPGEWRDLTAAELAALTRTGSDMVGLEGQKRRVRNGENCGAGLHVRGDVRPGGLRGGCFCARRNGDVPVRPEL